VESEHIAFKDHTLDAAKSAPLLVVSLNVDVLHIRDGQVWRLLRSIHDEIVLAGVVVSIQE
jgi:hypothetical protein